MAMLNDLYTTITIEGVKCLVWLQNTTTDSTSGSEKRKLKKQKHELGVANMDTPILDRQLRNNRIQYCDVIVHTDHLEQWEEAIQKCFAKYKQIRQSLANGNRKLVIRNGDNTEDHLVIHFYSTTSKFMVQPGQFKEENLLNFVSIIPSLRHLPEDSCVWDTEQPTVMTTDTYKLPLQVKLPPLDQVQNYSGNQNSLSIEGHKQNAERIGPDTLKQNNLSSLTSYSQTAEQKMHSDLPNCSRTATSTTQIDSTHNLTSSEAQTDLVLKENFSQTEGIQPERVQGVRMVVDELLFFIQNKLSMKPLTLDVLIQICANFYNAEEIFSSKKPLFDTIKQDRFRFIKRIGQGKKQDDLMDVCKLLLSTEIAHLPMFVARDLSKIPCTTDTYDVTKVHKELEVLKKSICDLTANQTALTDIVSSHLQNSNQVRHHTDIQSMNIPREKPFVS